MGIENRKSVAISNGDSSQPRVLSPSHLVGSSVKNAVGRVELDAADSVGSVYRICRVPSNAVMQKIELLNDAIVGASDFDLGLYKTAEDDYGAAIDPALFASAISLVGRRTLPLDALYEKLNIDNIELRLWEILGYEKDPLKFFDICLTANVLAGGVGGTLAMRVAWSL